MIDTTLLYREIRISKEINSLTKDAHDMLLDICEDISLSLKYSSQSDRSYCVECAKYYVILHWNKIDPNRLLVGEELGLYNYYSQVIKSGLSRGWGRLIKTRKMVNKRKNRIDKIYEIKSR